MKTVGIVAEYNPFHTGHLYHIENSRRLVGPNPDGSPPAVIAVISGNFVQRGDFAILNKHARAEAACASPSGPDLIIELPTPYACSTAEKFSSSAVQLLNACGVVTHISFGSEAGETESLTKIAEHLDSDEFREALSEELLKGNLFAKSRQNAVAKGLGKLADIMSSPNNILGIEYIRALNSLGSNIKPVTMKRIGVGHDATFSEEEVASASYIRSMINRGEAYSAMRYIPGGSIEVYLRELARGAGPINLSMNDALVLGQLRRLSVTDYEKLPDVSEGLHYRIYNAVKSARSVEEAADAAKTKRYTHARIRRILMCAYLGITSEDSETPPPYIRVLAFNDKGRSLLRQMNKKSTLPIIIKPSEAKNLSAEAVRIFDLESLATDLYMLSAPSTDLRKSGSDIVNTPYYKEK